MAGIIWDSGAASIRDCHVLVELGITNPNSKNHSGQDTQRVKDLRTVSRQEYTFINMLKIKGTCRNYPMLAVMSHKVAEHKTRESLEINCKAQV